MSNELQKGIWFWQANRNPSAHNEPDYWRPYTTAENAILEKAYHEGQRSAGVGDYVVDFDRGIQYKLSDHTKTRPIKRDCF